MCLHLQVHFPSSVEDMVRVLHSVYLALNYLPLVSEVVGLEQLEYVQIHGTLTMLTQTRCKLDIAERTNTAQTISVVIAMVWSSHEYSL